MLKHLKKLKNFLKDKSNCIYAFEYAYMCIFHVWAHESQCECGGQKITLGVASPLPSTLFSSTSFRHFFLHPHLIMGATQIEMVTATSCCMCVWESKLGPHICLTRMLANEPSPKPRVSSFHPINRYHNPLCIIRCFMKIRLVPDFVSNWKTFNHLW